MKFELACSCGETMAVEGENREEAVQKLKDTMTAEAISKHMAEKHPNEPVPAPADFHATIEQNLKAAA